MRALTEEFLLRQLDVGNIGIGGLLLRRQCLAVFLALLTLYGRLCRHFGEWIEEIASQGKVKKRCSSRRREQFAWSPTPHSDWLRPSLSALGIGRAPHFFLFWTSLPPYTTGSIFLAFQLFLTAKHKHDRNTTIDLLPFSTNLQLPTLLHPAAQRQHPPFPAPEMVLSDPILVPSPPAIPPLPDRSHGHTPLPQRDAAQAARPTRSPLRD